MLFTGISTFAQSVEPIKGDVNGDGQVDVADIANIIDIMAKGEAGYFYFGTVRPTAQNYNQLPGVIGSYTSIAEASGATATVAAGETLYMMCPASWVEGKSVEMEDEAGNSISFLEEKDVVTIPGYTIFRTQVFSDEKTVVLKDPSVTYYFSAGGTVPTVDNYTTVNSATTDLSKPIRWYNDTGHDAVVYVVAPSDKTVIMKDGSILVPFPCIEYPAISIPNHKVWVSADYYYQIDVIARGSYVQVELF